MEIKVKLRDIMVRFLKIEENQGMMKFRKNWGNFWEINKFRGNWLKLRESIGNLTFRGGWPCRSGNYLYIGSCSEICFANVFPYLPAGKSNNVD